LTADPDAPDKIIDPATPAAHVTVMHEHTEKPMTTTVLKRQVGAKTKPVKSASHAPSAALAKRDATHREIGELLVSIRDRAEALSTSADRLLARLT
jgi:hypothetical protein